MMIDLPNIPSDVLAMGKVLRSTKLDDGTYEVGVQFWWTGWEKEDDKGQEPQTISTDFKSTTATDAAGTQTDAKKQAGQTQEKTGTQPKKDAKKS
jgi:hypothetical protein